jgi:PIN domain nuclease of toxin-antitoxin system
MDDVPRLSDRAVLEIEKADAICVSPITLYEICQKVRLGKWPEMAAHVNRLHDLLEEQSIGLAPLSAEVSIRAGLIEWDHRDPFDRIIAATALVGGMAMISSDTAFDEVLGLRRIWE